MQNMCSIPASSLSLAKRINKKFKTHQTVNLSNIENNNMWFTINKIKDGSNNQNESVACYVSLKRRSGSFIWAALLRKQSKKRQRDMAFFHKRAKIQI